LLETARATAAGDQNTVDQKLESLQRKHFQVADELFTGARREQRVCRWSRAHRGHLPEPVPAAPHPPKPRGATAAVDAEAVLHRRPRHRLTEDLFGAGMDFAGVHRAVNFLEYPKDCLKHRLRLPAHGAGRRCPPVFGLQTGV